MLGSLSVDPFHVGPPAARRTRRADPKYSGIPSIIVMESQNQLNIGFTARSCDPDHPAASLAMLVPMHYVVLSQAPSRRRRQPQDDRSGDRFRRAALAFVHRR